MKNKKIAVHHLVIIILLLIIIILQLNPQMNVQISLDSLGLWLTIYGGVVTVFTLIAFINSYTSKTEFEKIKINLEMDSKKVFEEYQTTINNLDKAILSQEIRYEEFIKQNKELVEFNQLYSEYLSIERRYSYGLIAKLESYIERTDDVKAHKIISELYGKTIQNEAENSFKINQESFSKMIKSTTIVLDSFNINRKHLNEVDYSIIHLVEMIESILDKLIIDSEHGATYSSSPIVIQLESLREKLEVFYNLKEAGDSNYLSDYESGIRAYCMFLERQIDFQLLSGTYGSDWLITQLINFMCLIRNQLFLRDLTPFGNYEYITKEISRIEKKYSISIPKDPIFGV